MDYELILIVAAAFCGFFLTRRYLNRAPKNRGGSPAGSPAAAPGDGRAVTAAEMEEMNRAAQRKRLECLASRG
jgi:hypothetical protein